VLYEKLGKLDEAKKMYQRTLQGYEVALGPDHISTLQAVNNLGGIYSKLGKLDEGEKMYQRALQGFKAVLGPDHTSTRKIVANLNIIHKVQRDREARRGREDIPAGEKIE
jgi:tetratricopeptide (TPR) repeat protein